MPALRDFALPGAILLVLAGQSFTGRSLAADNGVMQHKEGFRDAVTAPLEDLNLKQTDIPDVLRRAKAGPYDLNGLDHCEAVAGEVGRLDAVLGPDLDEAKPPDVRSNLQKAGAGAHDAAVSAVRGETQSVLPFRGWIRKLTGAERHQKLVDEAIRAGNVRRGYLKGVGMRMNCAPPAAPSWFKPQAPQKPRQAAVSAWTAFWLRLVAWWRSWWPF